MPIDLLERKRQPRDLFAAPKTRKDTATKEIKRLQRELLERPTEPRDLLADIRQPVEPVIEKVSEIEPEPIKEKPLDLLASKLTGFFKEPKTAIDIATGGLTVPITRRKEIADITEKYAKPIIETYEKIETAPKKLLFGKEDIKLSDAEEFEKRSGIKDLDIFIPTLVPPITQLKKLRDFERNFQRQIIVSVANMVTSPTYWGLVTAPKIIRGAKQMYVSKQGKIIKDIKSEMLSQMKEGGIPEASAERLIDYKLYKQWTKAGTFKKTPRALNKTLNTLKEQHDDIVAQYRDVMARKAKPGIVPVTPPVKPTVPPEAIRPPTVPVTPKPVKLVPEAMPKVEEVKTAISKRGIKGDELLNTVDKVEEILLNDKTAEIDKEGFITLYHRTTPENAKSIVESGKMKKKEISLFFGTKSEGQISGYGDAVVKVKVPIEDIEIDDVFENEVHVTIPSKNLEDVKIKTELVKPPIEPIKPVVKPEVKPPAKPKVEKPEITKKQARVRIVAKEKLLTDPKTGKFKPQYRRLVEGMFGKKIRTRDMTVEQLKIMEDAIRALPKPIYKKGKLQPPSIPRTSKLVTEEFFRRKFKQPTPLSLLTSQNYYTEILGVSELSKPLELAKQRMDLEYRGMSRSVDEMGTLINKISKVTIKEKLQAKLKNIPTRAISEMRDLLDKHEEAPADLDPKKVKIFNWFRNLNRSMLKGENEVRKKLNLPEIPHRKAYVKHVSEGMAKEMLLGKYPFPEGLKYWSEKIVGSKVFNPSEMQRQLAEDTEKLFTKDLVFATKSMLWTALKEIHLSQPLRAFNEQLGALSKDLPIYENLSAEELKELRDMSVMPASTKNWLIKYVNTVIKGQETQLDASVNRIITQHGIGGVLNKLMKPFGRVLSQKPITNLFSRLGRLTIHGVMGWRPKQLIRNKFQLIQNLALYTTKANLKGFLPASVDKNLVKLMKESIFLESYTGVEELPTNIQKRLEKLWMAPFQWTAVTNASQSTKVAYWDTLELITNPKYKKYGWADPQRTYKEPKGKLYKSEEEKLLKEMEFGAGVTQFSYIPIGMPQAFRYKAFVPVTRLQSWWMNYFTKFTRESILRMFKGETSYGAKLPPSRRMGYLRYLLLGGAILSSLGYKRAFLLGVLPTYMSPAAQIALGAYLYVAADSDWQRKKAKKRIHQSWTAFIPGSLAWKDWNAVWTGKKDWSELFTYIKKTGKQKTKWR